MHRLFLTIGTVLVIACGGSESTGPAHTLSGQWSGAISGTVGPQVLSLDLLNVGADIEGTGSLIPAPTSSGTLSFAVSGSFTTPNMTVSLTSGTLQPITLSATYDGRQLNGAVFGSGFNGQTVVLTKQ
jgi:hypothetical protein